MKGVGDTFKPVLVPGAYLPISPLEVILVSWCTVR